MFPFSRLRKPRGRRTALRTRNRIHGLRRVEEEPQSLPEEIGGHFRAVLKQELKERIQQAVRGEVGERLGAHPTSAPTTGVDTAIGIGGADC